MVRDWEQLLHVLEDIERERVIDRLTSIDEADEDLYCGHRGCVIFCGRLVQG